MTRKQAIGLEAFIQLNRERGYYSVAHFLKPDYIKEVAIRDYYDRVLKQSISYDFFLRIVQGLDDAYMKFTEEQIRSQTNK